MTFTYTLKQTGTDFRTFGVQSNGNGQIGDAQLLAGNLGSLTHIQNSLQMVLAEQQKISFVCILQYSFATNLVSAMRKVHAGHIHASLDHLHQLGDLARGRTCGKNMETVRLQTSH